MTDLRVDAPVLLEASASVLRAASGVRMDADFAAPNDDTLCSDAVEHALRLGSQQQALRAGLTADALAAVGWSPHEAVGAFTDADAALARVF